ncbi:hypothetical protein ACVSQB_02000 [Bradyrhizobium elkanii]
MSNEMRHLSVYDGRNLVGTVNGIDRTWLAFDAIGNALPGEFSSYRAAAAAVSAARANPCASDDRFDGSP